MVEIQIIGDKSMNINEYSAAQTLKEVLIRDLTDKVNGKILIAVGVTCLGQKINDIDIVIFGSFEKEIKRNIYTKIQKQKQLEDYKFREICISNFCFSIEVKDHSAENIKFEHDKAWVRYKGHYHNASDQSIGQKYALKGYLQERLKGNWSPFICNFIWFRNVQKVDLPSLPHNYLPSTFSFNELMTQACISQLPYYQTGSVFFKSSNMLNNSLDEVRQAISYFSDYKKEIGNLTRSKLEKITRSSILNDQQYVKEIGNKLVLIQGRAGTGKTIKLIHIAFELSKQGDRCLILTYNKALVSDIRRLLALTNISSSLDEGTVSIKSVHSFMFSLLQGTGVFNGSRIEAKKEYELELNNLLTQGTISLEQKEQKMLDFEDQYFLENYDDLKKELIFYLEEGLITHKNIMDLMRDKKIELFWDKLLIDEGQDWPEDEKEILFKMYNSNCFIIADGVDQLVRRPDRIDWTKNTLHHTNSKGQRKSLRQKANLCRFVKSYADVVGMHWDIEPQDDLVGGKVIVITNDYDQQLHKTLLEDCKKDGNKAYEMMFLVPPSFVEEIKLYEKGKKPYYKRRFKLTEAWEKWGIKLWDGTSSDLRTEFPYDVDQHRLLQYDSARGLEGWVVTCLAMDELFEYKKETYVDTDYELALYSKEEKAKIWAYQWTLIPLTRAIDTLVINIKNPNSEFAMILREVTERCKDFVEWIDYN